MHLHSAVAISRDKNRSDTAWDERVSQQSKVCTDQQLFGEY